MSNMELVCVIVDDEARARENLKRVLSNAPFDVSIKKLFESGIDALAYLKQNSVDVVFVDIDMPKMDGFQFISSLNSLEIKTKSVIVSAHDEYGIKAVKHGATDYILKPIIRQEIYDCLQKIHRDKIGHDKQRFIIVAQNGTTLKFNHKDVLYIESDNVYSKIHLIGGDVKLASKSIKQMEENLVDSGFYRIHNQIIVNINMVKSFSKGSSPEVMLKSNIKLPISRRRLKSFIELMTSI